MHLIIVGINFKTAGVSIRENLYFAEHQLSDALNRLMAYHSVKGCVILSTCNRVEVYASVDEVENGFRDVIDFMCRYHHIPVEDLSPFIYKHNCQAAVVHLFKVISSLDSMVIGEYQIQGQVRDAYFAAQTANCTNSMLNKIFQIAIQIGKKVRSETNIGAGSVSVATLAVEMVKQVFSEKNSLRILLVGAGEMSNLTAKNFQSEFDDCQISITNRTNENAEDMAKKFDARVIAYSERISRLNEFDVIIVSTSAPNYILCKHDISKANISPEEVKVFIDLSIPRNVDPEINTIENCQVFSIDDINNVIDSNMDKRATEISKAEAIINEISEDYYEWYSKQFIVPTMKEIKKELGIIKQNTFTIHDHLVSSLSPEQQELMSKMMDTYTDKIIKIIMINFRKSHSQEDLIAMTQKVRKNLTLDVNE